LLLQRRAEESKIDSRETPEPTGLEFAAKFSRRCTWVHFSSVKWTLMQERKKVGFGMRMHPDEKLLSSTFA